jgi:hypothetical protein
MFPFLLIRFFPAGREAARAGGCFLEILSGFEGFVKSDFALGEGESHCNGYLRPIIRQNFFNHS